MPEVVLHFVYGLTDPRLEGDAAVRYIGVTSKPNTRYQTHLACYSSDPIEKNAWVRDVQSAGMELGIEILDVFKASRADKSQVRQREASWIKYYLDLGADLLNIQNSRGSSRRRVLLEDPSGKIEGGAEIRRDDIVVVDIDFDDLMRLIEDSGFAWGVF